MTEPEAYMYDGEYERKAAELNHPDLISIKQSNVSIPYPCMFLKTSPSAAFAS